MIAAHFQLIGVTRRYGARAALDSIDAAFAAGSVTAIVGSSGSGKSTLLRLLLGLETADIGEVRVEAELLQPSRLAAIRHRIGYVIQDGGLFPHLSVRDNLALLPRHFGWAAARIDARIAELLKLTQLPEDLLIRRPRALSGGQRQRVALARALMTDPPALLLDEPLGALDPITRHALQDELKGLFAKLGKTVLLVTHDLAEAAWLAPELLLMHQGRIVQRGSLSAFYEQPAEPFVERFIRAQRGLPGAGP